MLSLSSALLGEVSSNLRKALIKQENNKIYVRLIYTSDMTEADKEMASVVATSVMADFPDHQVIEEFLAIAKTLRIEVPHGWYLVFSRNEDTE